MITKQNYESWFLLYADNELSASEQELVLNFVSLHPELKTEFDVIQQVKLIPEEVTMPNKSSLKLDELKMLETIYRFEPDQNIIYPNKQELYRKTPVFSFPLMGRWAVAASIVLLVGLFWWIQQQESIEPMTVKEIATVSESPLIPAKESVNQELSNVDQPIAKSLISRVRTTKKIEETSRSIDQSLMVVQEDNLISDEVQVGLTGSIDRIQGQSNFTKEVLDAATDRMKAEPIQAVAATSSPNMEALLRASLPEENEGSLFKGLIRKISRKVLHENDDGDAKVIQVANFHIHVKN